MGILNVQLDGSSTQPPGDVLGVAGVSLRPEAVGAAADACKARVARGRGGGRPRRIVLDTYYWFSQPYLMLAQSWKLSDIGESIRLVEGFLPHGPMVITEHSPGVIVSYDHMVIIAQRVRDHPV